MTWFQKLSNGANKLFGKVGGNDKNLLRKVGNTARKIDNSISRVGSFLANTANTYGQKTLADTINGATSSIHQVRGHLQNAIRAPMSDVRHNNLEKVVKEPEGDGKLFL